MTHGASGATDGPSLSHMRACARKRCECESLLFACSHHCTHLHISLQHGHSGSHFLPLQLLLFMSVERKMDHVGNSCKANTKVSEKPNISSCKAKSKRSKKFHFLFKFKSPSPAPVSTSVHSVTSGFH